LSRRSVSAPLHESQVEEDRVNHQLELNARSSAMKRVPGKTRFWIVWTLFFSTVTNYFNRQTFSVLSPMIARQYHFSHGDIAKILGAFQVSYAITFLVGGIVVDAIGVRLGLALAAVLWSVVNMFTGFANSVFSFTAFRFMLGVGEGFNWPAASKTVAEWFPSDERSLAVAIFDSGSSVGGALAALVIPWIALAVGWRWAFVCSGILGLVWLAIWLYVYHPLDRHPRVSRAEVEAIRARQQMLGKQAAAGMRKWPSLLTDSNVWGVVLGRGLTDPIWWFYVFWLPQYLSDARGFSLEKIALFAWIPFVAADIGNFTGGLVSGYCIRKEVPVVRARKWVCGVSCLPILAGIPAAQVHNAYLALGLICIALWGFASWSTMGLTLPSDLFPQDVVATVTGLSGFAAGLISALFTLAVGMLVDRFSSYRPAFLAAGLLPLFATAAVFLFIHPAKTSPATGHGAGALQQ
jgi:ACS family hexuronate transporter-like MFS transporter